MGALSSDDLKAPFRKGHPNEGDLRYTLVYKKIQEGSEFKLTTGAMIRLEFVNKTIEETFKTGKGLATLNFRNPIFQELSGTRTFTVGKLEKTKEFGGGAAGSGAGAALTDLGESAQCLYAALAFYVYGRKIKESEIIKPTDFKKAMNYVSTTASLQEMIDDLPNDWKKSSIRGANKLFEKFGQIRASKRFKFHRGSAEVKKIEGFWRAVTKKEGITMDINKWSPADIYLIADMADLDVLGTHNALKAFNNEMLVHYNNKDVIGVSLKKITQETARFSELNVETTTKASKGNGNIKFYGYTVKASDTATIYNSMDAYIKWGLGRSERIQIRSFGQGEGLTGFQGELKGESANQGKISLGPMKYLIKEYTGTIIPESNVIAQKARTKDQGLAAEIYELAKWHGVNNLPTLDQHMKNSFDEELHGGMSARWRYSKWFALTICKVLANMSEKDANAFIYDVYSYAGSKSSLSAPYAKVE